MHDKDIIPIQQLTEERAAQLVAAPILAKLPASVPTVAYRAPGASDDTRWRPQTIGGRGYRVAQPVTFTPYASAKPCSARCRFCSEALIEKASAKPSSSLRPGGEYFHQLQAALDQLRGLPLSYSLSGLETTNDPQWLQQMLDVLERHAACSPVNERVLYTNGSGLAHAVHGAELIERLAAFGLDWVELSRHHHREEVNQSIMRFRSGVEVQRQERFAAMLRQLIRRIPVKLVCIVQDGGIATASDVLRYLEWARQQGVEAVIFREFSQLDDSYMNNVTSRYIASARIPMAGLLEQCLNQSGFAGQFAFEQVTEGYYFWNLIGRYRGMRVTFEASDYALMHQQHRSGNVYKLVFHANGNLCAGWNPERHVLFASAREEALIG